MCLCVIKLFLIATPTVFPIHMKLGTYMIYVSIRKKIVLLFRNFAFKIVGEFFKILNWD